MHAGKIRLAIAGIGNCASSLVQGLSYYRNDNENVPVELELRLSVEDWTMKSPPVQFTDSEAKQMLEKFIAAG